MRDEPTSEPVHVAREQLVARTLDAHATLAGRFVLYINQGM